MRKEGGYGENGTEKSFLSVPLSPEGQSGTLRSDFSVPFLDYAPMEGITGWPYRLAHSRLFPSGLRYYTPFITANGTFSLKTKEKKETAPENNQGVVLIPQILTNRVDAFLWAVRRMAAAGYGTVNLNLGCPSATVVTHGKGAGFLADPARLDAFFEDVFEGLEGRGPAAESGEGGTLRNDFSVPASPLSVRVTVKTRIGLKDASEAEELIRIFNRYPIDELIVHPRLRKDFYKGRVDLETFGRFFGECRRPLIYNGDIRSGADFEAIVAGFPGIRGVMIGRGLTANPALAREIGGGAGLSAPELRAFHDEVYRMWRGELPDARAVLGRMKELWYYWSTVVEGEERALKGVRKAKRYDEYEVAVRRFFSGARVRRVPAEYGSV